MNQHENQQVQPAAQKCDNPAAVKQRSPLHAGADVIPQNLQKIDEQKIFSSSGNKSENGGKLTFGMGATTAISFAAAVLAAHYVNDIL